MVFDFHSNYHSSGSARSQSGPILYPRHIPQMISWPVASRCEALRGRQREPEFRGTLFETKMGGEWQEWARRESILNPATRGSSGLVSPNVGLINVDIIIITLSYQQPFMRSFGATISNAKVL